MINIKTTAVRVKPKSKPYTVPLVILLVIVGFCAAAYFAPVVLGVVLGIGFLSIRVSFVLAATFLPLILLFRVDAARTRIPEYLVKILLFGLGIIGISLLVRSVS